MFWSDIITPNALSVDILLVIICDSHVLVCVQCLGCAYSTLTLQYLHMKLPALLVKKVRVKQDLVQNGVIYDTN